MLGELVERLDEQTLEPVAVEGDLGGQGQDAAQGRHHARLALGRPKPPSIFTVLLEWWPWAMAARFAHELSPNGPEPSRWSTSVAGSLQTGEHSQIGWAARYAARMARHAWP